MQSIRFPLLLTLTVAVVTAGCQSKSAKNLGHLDPVSAWAAEGNVAECRRALDSGHSPHERTSHGSSYEWTPLHWAAAEGHPDAAELLISRGADVNARSLGGWAPLHEAVRFGRTDTVELLITRGADVNAKSNADLGSDTPLHVAAERGDADMERLLVAKGAGVDARDDDGRTPLYRAVWSDEAAGVLIVHGADVNAKDKSGRTPLHQAAALGCMKVATALIAKGADVNAKDNAGETPVAAALNGYRYVQQFDWSEPEGVATLLRQHGAKD